MKPCLVKILVGTVRSKFLTPYPRTLVDAAISCYRKNYFFTTAFRQRRWDGKLHLLTAGGAFPSGVAPLVAETLKKEGFEVEYLVPEDHKPLPVMNSITGPFGPLIPRDYQLESVSRVLKAQRGVLRLATASGKTLVGAMIAHAFDASTLVLVHGQQLVDQTYEKFCSYLGPEKIGMAMAETYKPGKFLIGSIDTLASRLYAKDPPISALIKGCRVVIADEAHRVGQGARTFRAVLDACPAVVRVGMSGTPFTKSEDTDLILQGCTGPLLYDLPPEKLQRAGILANANLTIYEINEPTGCSHYNWREALNFLIIDNEERNHFIMGVALDRARKGKRVLLISGFSVKLVRNFEKLYKEFQAADPTLPSATFIARKDTVSGKYRATVNNAVASLRNGSLSILCSTVIFDEGTDIPDLDVVIFAATTKSFVRVMQRIGRGLRIKEGGHALEVIDFLDTTNPYLMKHFQARLKVYEDEKLFSSTNVWDSGVKAQQHSASASRMLEQYDETEEEEDLLGLDGDFS